MKPVEIDGGENVSQVGRGHVELGEQFDFSASNAGIDVQFSRDGDEILLQHLQRHNAGPGTPVLCHEIEGASLLRRCRLVVRVDENVSVEEATSAHESRCDRSASHASGPDPRGA